MAGNVPEQRTGTPVVNADRFHEVAHKIRMTGSTDAAERILRLFVGEVLFGIQPTIVLHRDGTINCELSTLTSLAESIPQADGDDRVQPYQDDYPWTKVK